MCSFILLGRNWNKPQRLSPFHHSPVVERPLPLEPVQGHGFPPEHSGNERRK
jgi:hypothetical protein